MDRRRSCVLAALLATASAFAPRAAPRCGVAVSESPLDRLGGLLGGKKAAPPPIVEDVAVDDVAPGEMTTAVEGLTPELDGLRKANALFNQGLIGRDEIDDAASAAAGGVAGMAKGAVGGAADLAAGAVKGLAGAVVDAAVVKPAKAVGDKVAYELGAPKRAVDAAAAEAAAAPGRAADRLKAEADAAAAAAAEDAARGALLRRGVQDVVDSVATLPDATRRAAKASVTVLRGFSALAASGRRRGDKAKELTESVVADTKAAARAAAEEKVAEKQFKAAAEKARADEPAPGEASDSLLLEANYLDDDTRAKLAADLAARLVKKTEAAAEEKRREKS
ncbi:hypothetical protein JL720_14717 [Aureococcus anophagefferens]|nr:hypothetical protein JL720_14717 [Aureococcus anophagefferens]